MFYDSLSQGFEQPSTDGWSSVDIQLCPRVQYIFSYTSGTSAVMAGRLDSVGTVSQSTNTKLLQHGHLRIVMSLCVVAQGSQRACSLERT